MKGVFAAFRNPAAHEPKIVWTMTEQDALDVLGAGQGQLLGGGRRPALLERRHGLPDACGPRLGEVFPGRRTVARSAVRLACGGLLTGEDQLAQRHEQGSRVVAVQHAAQGVRVNTVVPGQLHTPMVEARLARQRAGGDVEALLAQRQKRIPLGFMGDGRDTAAAVLFLASDEARFITGTEIVVDGGMVARCD